MSADILTAATSTANEWRELATAWHLVVAALGVAAWQRVDGRTFAAGAMLYGLIGVFVLHVTIDWFLTAGAAVLLARTAVALRLVAPVTLDPEKRHI